MHRKDNADFSARPFSAQQFGFFRITFGIYLIWHFATLIPYGEELFGAGGVMGKEGVNPFAGKWPNLLMAFGFEGATTLWLFLSVAASALFTLGRARRLSAAFLWYSLSCLFTANPLIANPSLAYIGLLLLLSLLVPTGEAYTWKMWKKPTPPTAHPDWEMPRMVCITAWVLLAVGYSFSGILKLGSPSWMDGSALGHLMENPLARPGMAREIMRSLPDIILQSMTWGVLLLEIFFLPLALFKPTRKWAWLAMLLMHFGIMTTVDFADLSLGMVMIHLFTYQRSWLPHRPAIGEKNHILFLDGDCLFCQQSARTLANLDDQETLSFAPLQGQTAQDFLRPEWRDTTRSNAAAVCVENPGTEQQRIWRGADAVLRALYLIGGPSSLLWPLHRIPGRETVYQFISRHRLNILPIRSSKSSRSSCPIPTPSLQKRFLP